ncbi:hypothetical protein [Mycobacteroides abscessus]|uniref:hypothetical protein n=1 Tax=Mycobacteroides abscessus TaxID=36809 RepID=UPI00092783D8|nr:hypothetical protein [Mycobacteroides abscessus]SIL73860.1 Uncharacterised protein [Mycobacteroides abscessus subsp. abscessus]SLC85397.1 Uncharacterised protein [Mycobacteroides abscessus subsp. abscessus]
MSDIDWETVEVDDGFRAAHHGVCGKCRAVGGHYEHVKCDIDVDAEADAALVSVCPDCNLEHAGGCF